MDAERAAISPPEDASMSDALARLLPEDILFNMLTWLPAKSLCRFRCVSRRWRAIISEPAFIAAQGSHAAPLVVGVFDGAKTLELRVMDMDGTVLRVVEHVERKKLQRTRLDLACLAGVLYGACAIDPATGRPVTIRSYVDDDPKANRQCYSGFGRATPSGVYKAVRLVVRAPMEVMAEIADLEGGGDKLRWRQGPAAPFVPCCCSWCTCTVDGVIFFMPRDVHDHNGRNCVAAFDLETEEWKPVIRGPEEVLWDVTLAELKGSLTMVNFEEPWCQTNVWFLVDPEKSIWVKKHVIQMHCWCLITPLDILSDGRMLLLNMVQKQEQNSHSPRWVLQLHDHRTGAHTDLFEMPKEYRGQITLYRASLLC